MGPVATGAAVSVLAATAALVQPRAGRALDTGRLSARTGLGIGLALAAAGLACATLTGLVGVLLAAMLIGVGTGLITPLAFAALAASTPPERLGQTMGTAELGRELGDAGGPLLVAGIATATALSFGYASLAILLAAGPAAGLIRASLRHRHRSRQP
jgi:MFS family permease